MRRIVKQFGGPEVLSIEERPAPAPRPGHVLMEVKATSKSKVNLAGVRCRHSVAAGGRNLLRIFSF